MSKNMSSKEELDLLLNNVLKVAKFLLEKNGEYYPFAHVIDNNGDIRIVASYDGDEHPNPNKLLSQLVLAFKEEIKKKSIRAVGLCINTDITISGGKDKMDAVEVQLEHEDGKAVNIYLPYKKLKSEEFEYREIIATSRSPKFFVRET